MKHADKAQSNQHIVSPACQNSEQQLNSVACPITWHIVQLFSL